MNILVAPTAFKGSLSAMQVADAITEGLRRSHLKANITQRPIADGGDSTFDVIMQAHPAASVQTVTVRDALSRPIQAAYGLLNDGKTAIIEMAQASGMRVLGDTPPDALRASTLGTGDLMQHALDAGAETFILGLGGSATSDGGTGTLQALGMRFFDSDGTLIRESGAQILARIADVSFAHLDPRWQAATIQLIADVDNPPTGQNGAVRVFGPQKGITPDQFDALDAAMERALAVLADATGNDARGVAGAGAAGALAAGLIAGLGAEIMPGTSFVLDLIGFDDALTDVDLVITGEGSLDHQTLRGKGPFGVAQRAQARGIPVIGIAGRVNLTPAQLRANGFVAAFAIPNGPMTLTAALRDATSLIERTAENLGTLLQFASTNTIK